MSAAPGTLPTASCTTRRAVLGSSRPPLAPRKNAGVDLGASTADDPGTASATAHVQPARRTARSAPAVPFPAPESRAGSNRRRRYLNRTVRTPARRSHTAIPAWPDHAAPPDHPRQLRVSAAPSAAAAWSGRNTAGSTCRGRGAASRGPGSTASNPCRLAHAVNVRAAAALRANVFRLTPAASSPASHDRINARSSPPNAHPADAGSADVGAADAGHQPADRSADRPATAGRPGRTSRQLAPPDPAGFAGTSRCRPAVAGPLACRTNRLSAPALRPRPRQSAAPGRRHCLSAAAGSADSRIGWRKPGGAVRLVRQPVPPPPVRRVLAIGFAGGG